MLDCQDSIATPRRHFNAGEVLHGMVDANSRQQRGAMLLLPDERDSLVRELVAYQEDLRYARLAKVRAQSSSFLHESS